MMQLKISILLITTIVIFFSHLAFGDTPFADAHIHYNWDHAEIISAEDVVKKLIDANVKLAIVSSTPTHLALELKKAGGNIIVPFFSPYTHELGKRDWYLNKELIQQVEQGLRSGQYQGIGEVHFMSGFQPSMNNEVFINLVRLAISYNVPMLIHIDGGNESLLLQFCQKNPALKIIFAHAGGNLKPPHIKNILHACKNVSIDFAARDPWRYDGLTNDRGLLLPGWRDLVIAMPDRFITGTDPVWKVTRTQSWDQSDDGWDHYDKLLKYHLTWIDELPTDIQINIRWNNVNSILKR